MKSFDAKDQKTPAAQPAAKSTSSETKPKKKVLYYSFDWDCSLGPKTNTENPADPLQHLIKENENVIQKIKDDIAKYGAENIADIQFLVGSNRQSAGTDLSNMLNNKNGSPIQGGLEKLKEHMNAEFKKDAKTSHLQAKVDPYLMAGVYNELAEGRKPPTGGQQFHGMFPTDEWIFDSKKRTLLLAQIHHAAKYHPDEEVVFQFLDDHVGILKELMELFTNNKDLIPDNVTLQTYIYDSWEPGKLILPQINIKGEGEIIPNIAEIMRKFAQASYPDAFNEAGLPVPHKPIDWSNPTVADYSIFKSAAKKSKKVADLKASSAKSPGPTAGI